MPLTRRQIYRRRRIVVFGGLFAVLAGIAYLPLTLFAPVTETAAALQTPSVESAPAAETSLPSYGASAISAVGYPGLLAQAGTSDAVPLASIAKVVTALTVLDAHPISADNPGPAITMTAADVSSYRDYLARNGSVAPVRSGWTFTERELIEIMLIDSANNYATTIVQWAFGSNQAYLDAATAWLAKNGLTNMTVVDSSGLDPRSTGTIGDVVRLGEIALQNPVVAEIVGTASIHIHDIGLVTNTNAMIGRDGIDGIKTGTLFSFGANLLFSSTIEVGTTNIRLVGAVLGGPDHPTINAAIASLISQAREGFHEVQLVTEGEVFASYATSWDAEARAVAAESASFVVWGDTDITVEASVQGIRLGEAGEVVGEATFTAGHQTHTVQLVLSDDIEDPGPWWRLSHPEIIFGM
jgi:D-alanyl-D-alanine carboxypeptidase (penicillin-binding protein 5/6)